MTRESNLKADLHTPILSVDFWNAPSKLKQKKSPQCNDFSDFEKSVNKLQILVRYLHEFRLEILKIFSRPTKLACVSLA